jgi:hypothetical protein
MKLIELLSESEQKDKKFCEFAEKRLGGATKIADSAKEKGGPAMLTYHHFVVKLPYYKKAANGNFDLEQTKKDYKECLDKLCELETNLNQVEFQRLVGKIEVLGELIIKNK